MINARRPKPESLLKSFCDPFESSYARPQPGIALLAARRQLEKAALAARQATQQANAADHAKASFLANMSHELRTPLNAIIGFSELIKLNSAQARERHLEYAGYIYDAGISLLQLVTAILDLARVQAGQCDLDEELVSVGEVLMGPMRSVRRLAERKSISIISAIEDPATLIALDRMRIEQALFNVLSNAVKYTPAGGVVTVEARCNDAGDLAIRIADTGIGIPPEQLKRVLEPFEQLESPLTRHIDGVGLGLPIAKALMALHGGELAIGSEPGRGTSVELRLPGVRVRPPFAAVAD